MDRERVEYSTKRYVLWILGRPTYDHRPVQTKLQGISPTAKARGNGNSDSSLGLWIASSNLVVEV